MSLNEVASAMFLIDYVNDVTRELTYAKNKLLYLNDISFSIPQIVSEQKELKQKYAELL